MAACDPEKETQYSKLDYFDEHLYIRMIRHKLVGTMTFADTLRSNMPVVRCSQPITVDLRFDIITSSINQYKEEREYSKRRVARKARKARQMYNP